MERTNRRRHHRRLDQYKVFVQVILCEREAELNHQTFLCRTQDISRSGLNISLEQSLPVGTLIDLWLDNPVLGKKCFLSGEIQWTQPFNEQTHYQHGVKLHQPLFSDTEQWQRIFDQVDTP